MHIFTLPLVVNPTDVAIPQCQKPMRLTTLVGTLEVLKSQILMTHVLPFRFQIFTRSHARCSVPVLSFGVKLLKGSLDRCARMNAVSSMHCHFKRSKPCLSMGRANNIEPHSTVGSGLLAVAGAVAGTRDLSRKTQLSHLKLQTRCDVHRLLRRRRGCARRRTARPV